MKIAKMICTYIEAYPRTQDQIMSMINIFTHKQKYEEHKEIFIFQDKSKLTREVVFEDVNENIINYCAI